MSKPVPGRHNEFHVVTRREREMNEEFWKDVDEQYEKNLKKNPNAIKPTTFVMQKFNPKY